MDADASSVLEEVDVVPSWVRHPHSSSLLGKKFFPFFKSNFTAHFDVIRGISFPRIRRSHSTPPSSLSNSETASPTPSPRPASTSKARRTCPQSQLNCAKNYRINTWNVCSEQIAFAASSRPDPYRYFRRFHHAPEYSRQLIKLSHFAFFEERWKSYTDAFNAAYPLHKMTIYPHQYTEDPTVAWEMLKTKRPVKNVRQMKLDAPIKSDHVRFVCVACTHGAALDPASLPPGDILIIAGDFTSCGLPKEVKSFNENMALMKHTFKIAISGNHECTFDDSFLKSAGKDIGEAKEVALKQALSAALSSAKVSNPRSLLTNVIYLQDSMVELFGIRIYGTPWQPRMDNWAFNLPRGQPLLNKWNQIPTGVDVLITHTPPLGHGDMLTMGSRAGCVELLNSVVKRIRPKYHVFGHVHEGYGCTSDGYTKFINCCLMNENLEMTNKAVIFDIPVDAEAKLHFMQNSKKLMKKLLKK
uniref:Calcineurin-like phosphoesterase domain-containing protein n=2 Tax=Parascaris univalens TaxID=6257 RepID=A0A915AJX5_PARUN